MAKFQIICGNKGCEKAIDSSMKVAIEKRECPYCGSPMVDAAFSALGGAEYLEGVLNGSGTDLPFIVRKKIIIHYLDKEGWPQISIIPEEQDKIAPKKISVEDAEVSGADEGLSETVSVGNTEGRGDGVADASRRKKGSLKRLNRTNLRKEMSTEGVTFGEIEDTGAADGAVGAGGNAAPKKISEIPIPENPLEAMGGEGTASGKGYSETK